MENIPTRDVEISIRDKVIVKRSLVKEPNIKLQIPLVSSSRKSKKKFILRNTDMLAVISIVERKSISKLIFIPL
ncbi:MAG: hypothetical protein ACP5H3_00045 [Candidatus Aenigmatarchaeota archaeon]|jgi:hypothetical protein